MNNFVICRRPGLRARSAGVRGNIDALRIVEVEVEEDEALGPMPAPPWGGSRASVDVRAKAGVDLPGLRDDRGLEHLGDVDALREQISSPRRKMSYEFEYRPSSAHGIV